MDVVITPEGTDLNVKVIGQITESDGEKLREAFEQVIHTNEKKVKMDLSLVPIITSTGIGKIIVLYRKLKSQGRELIITETDDNLYSIFTSINLDKMLTIQK